MCTLALKKLVFASLVKSLEAIRANILILIFDKVVAFATEEARMLELLEYDHIMIGINLNSILCADVKSSSEFDRKYDSAKCVDFSYDSC